MPRPSPLRDRAVRRRAAALVAVVLAALAGAVAAAAGRSGWGVVAALAFGAAVEVALVRALPFVPGAAARIGAGRPARTAVQMLALLLLAGRVLPPAELNGTALAAVVVVGLAVAAEAARVVIRRLRRLPLVTRNLDLGRASLPAQASPPVMARAMDPAGADAVVAIVAGLGLTIAEHHHGSAVAAALGLAVATVLAAAPVVVLGQDLLALIRQGSRRRMTEAAMKAVGTLAPEVVLYFAATVEELYQVRMWLEPLERLGRPCAIVLRSQEVFDALGEVPVPVVCSQFNGTIASLPLSSRVVALFVTHSGNNLSMVRRPEARTVFVGHGDSDKPDSVNPFARVYDEVWVAGKLGRRRYAEAGVGVADARIVEIGRPQIRPSGDPPPNPVTVVYAPTWEGWGDDPHHSSLAHVGPALVERLLARGDVRVRYRPHPLTGRRDPAVYAAHRRILELVDAVPEDETLAATFAQSWMLVGDVSSVVNDYLAEDRPYAVVDTRGLGPVAFVARFPSTAGGFVLPVSLDGLEEFVAAGQGRPDRTASARRALRADALGDPATSQERFAIAVTRLLA